MSPADILADARQNIVGPYLPAKPGWLAGWEGPRTRICERCGSLDIRRHCSYCGDSTFDHICNDGCKACGGVDVPALDVHRPEVRDHLVRLGCPEWARDVPAAVWAWGAGVQVADVITPWSDASDLAALNAGCILRVEGGWLVPLPGGGVGFFKEVSRDE